MALRDLPYLPLYVQDYLTDEKLNRCSASSQGIYAKMMCIFHKSDPYGGILLKQKDKQNESICLNFAHVFAKLLPFDLVEINLAIIELLDEKVLKIDGDFIYQKRMVEDNKLSEIRSLSGKKGGKKTQFKNKEFAKAKIKANTEYEIEDEDEDVIDTKKGGTGEKRFIPPTFEEVKSYCEERRNNVDPQKFIDFYSSKGWMIGKNKMKDWKASIRTWENNNSNNNGTGKQQQLGINPNSGVSDDYKRDVLNRLGVT